MINSPHVRAKLWVKIEKRRKNLRPKYIYSLLTGIKSYKNVLLSCFGLFNYQPHLKNIIFKIFECRNISKSLKEKKT